MEPSKKDIKKWCKALRSGEYDQITGQLENEAGYCCLGVACDIFIDKKDLELNSKGFIKGGSPSSQKNSPVWLNKISLLHSAITRTSLVELNDIEGFTFNEIADCLEAVYIHEVLND